MKALGRILFAKVSFTDVKDDKGIPRTFHSYTSGNRRVR